MSAMFQQNAQQIDWWTIILPSLITGFFVIVTQIIAALWVSRKTEEYKNDFLLDLRSFENSLSKRLEDYKKGINKDLYQFQTKFSLFHQKEAEAIASLYEKLVDLGKIVEHTFYRDGDQKQESTRIAIDKYHEYIDFYQKNRIYFDDQLCENIEEVVALVNQMTDKYIVSNRRNSENSGMLSVIRKGQAGEEELEIHLKFRVEFPKLRNKLRNKFRQILLTENTNDQIEKAK